MISIIVAVASPHNPRKMHVKNSELCWAGTLSNPRHYEHFDGTSVVREIKLYPLREEYMTELQRFVAYARLCCPDHEINISKEIIHTEGYKHAKRVFRGGDGDEDSGGE